MMTVAVAVTELRDQIREAEDAERTRTADDYERLLDEARSGELRTPVDDVCRILRAAGRTVEDMQAVLDHEARQPLLEALAHELPERTKTMKVAREAHRKYIVDHHLGYNFFIQGADTECRALAAAVSRATSAFRESAAADEELFRNYPESPVGQRFGMERLLRQARDKIHGIKYFLERKEIELRQTKGQLNMLKKRNDWSTGPTENALERLDAESQKIRAELHEAEAAVRDLEKGLCSHCKKHKLVSRMLAD